MRLVAMGRTTALILLLASGLFSQGGGIARVEWSGNQGRLVADDGRPVAAAASELARRFGIAISVEDPEYMHEADVVDVTEQVARNAVDHRILVPRSVRLQVPFEAADDGSPTNRVELVDDLIEAANASLPFAYRLDVAAMPFAIVPTKTRNARGEIVELTPLMDRVVSIPHGRRKVHESASLMAQALSAQTGLTVSCCQGAMGGYPWGLEEAEFGADNEPARNVLRRLLERTPGRYIWLLNCDPSPGQFCFINLHQVNATAKVAGGPFNLE